MNASTSTPRLTGLSSALRWDHRSPSKQVLPVRTAYAALAWVVVFFSFHIYWYAGGSFASPGKLPGLMPHHVVGWVLEPLGVAWPLGAWVCLAIARGWPRGRMHPAALIVVWLGCAALVVRGGAGLTDDLTRAVGLLPNGITGLSHKQTMGVAYYPVRVRGVVKQRHRRLFRGRRASLRPAGLALPPISIAGSTPREAARPRDLVAGGRR